MDEIKLLTSDLEKLVEMSSIPLDSLNEVKRELKTRDMVEYLDAIVERAKPEESLRQNFFYKGAPIMKLLGVRGSPRSKDRFRLRGSGVEGFPR
ncbi:hypothetical protein [Thermococcus sp. JCM 11816]|uniref:hypothetical protein n=1 Tax=Thermococcus sp. (strain JCM 11816 / KS-1) TaxID=1295125 RepID=UPI0006D00CE5